MDWTFLLRSEGPQHHVLQGSGEIWAETLTAFAKDQNPGLMLRWLRGSKMRTSQGVLDEFAAALQFPAYFGENWDALDETLNDLEWLHGGAAALLILEAEQLLQDAEPNEARSLFEILNADTSDVPLHVLFQVEADGATMLNGLGAMGLSANLITL